MAKTNKTHPPQKQNKNLSKFKRQMTKKTNDKQENIYLQLVSQRDNLPNIETAPTEK